MKQSEAADVDDGALSSVAGVEQEGDERKGAQNNVVGQVRQTLRPRRRSYEHRPT